MVTVQHFYKLSYVHICSFRCLSLLMVVTVIYITLLLTVLLDHYLTTAWPILDHYLTNTWPLVVLGGHCSHLPLSSSVTLVHFCRWLFKVQSFFTVIYLALFISLCLCLSLRYLPLFIDYSRWLSRGLLYHRYLWWKIRSYDIICMHSSTRGLLPHALHHIDNIDPLLSRYKNKSEDRVI